MANRHQQLAEKVVTVFRESLGDATCGQITEAQFEDLALMIREAIAEELEEAAGIVEEALKDLRARIEKPDLGM